MAVPHTLMAVPHTLMAVPLCFRVLINTEFIICQHSCIWSRGGAEERVGGREGAERRGAQIGPSAPEFQASMHTCTTCICIRTCICRCICIRVLCFVYCIRVWCSERTKHAREGEMHACRYTDISTRTKLC